MDMRGHGKSEGSTAYIEYLRDPVEDLRSFINKVLSTFYSKDQEFTNLPPVFIMAHGLGCMIALYLIMHFDWEIFEGLKLNQILKSASFYNPFFKWSNPKQMATYLTFIRMSHKLHKMQKDVYSFNVQKTPENLIDL